MILKLFKILLNINRRKFYLKGYINAITFVENFMDKKGEKQFNELYRLIQNIKQSRFNDLLGMYKEEDL